MKCRVGTDIGEAAEWLNRDEVVAVPTETVYGLAGNMYSAGAVDKIYAVKKRPRNNPLIVHAQDTSSILPLVREFPESARQLAEAFWPGPLTLVLPKSGRVPGSVTADQPTVAVRVPDHPLFLSLLQQLSFPLVAPSANPYTYISPVTASAVHEMLGNRIPYILDGGPCRKGIESTIVVLSPAEIRIARPGMISREQIESVLHTPVNEFHSVREKYPGMHYKHYSPRTPLLLTDNPLQAMEQFQHKRVALLLFAGEPIPAAAEWQYVLSPSGNLEEAARQLYASLYALDQKKVDCIIAEKMPDTGIGRSINDRLRKASTVA